MPRGEALILLEREGCWLLERDFRGDGILAGLKGEFYRFSLGGDLEERPVLQS